jgi:hypothetical protein
MVFIRHSLGQARLTPKVSEIEVLSYLEKRKRYAHKSTYHITVKDLNGYLRIKDVIRLGDSGIDFRVNSQKPFGDVYELESIRREKRYLTELIKEQTWCYVLYCTY